MSHFVLVTLHLFVAIIFVGPVFFEVLILEGIRRPVRRDVMRTVEAAIGRRARRLMRFVMATLYAAGIAMAWQYRGDLAHPFSSSFATLLSIKIVLALSVLAHFITAMTLGARGKLNSRHFKLIHLSVFCHVVLIVFLAKAMFFITWQAQTWRNASAMRFICRSGSCKRKLPGGQVERFASMEADIVHAGGVPS